MKFLDQSRNRPNPTTQASYRPSVKMVPRQGCNYGL